MPDFSKSVYMKKRDSDNKWNIFRTEDDTLVTLLPWLSDESYVRTWMGYLVNTLKHNHGNPNDVLSVDEYRSYCVFGYKRPKVLNRDEERVENG